MKSRAAASEFLVEICVRGGEFHHRLGAHGAHAGFGRGLGHLFLEVIHICEAGHTGADQLGAGNLCAQPDEIRRDELALSTGIM